MTSGTEAAEDQRDETPLERLDRNTMELLNELRVASTGIQVLFAFLLVIPFDSRFARLSVFDRYEYFLTLLMIAVAAVLLIAPSIHHRLLSATARSHIWSNWRTGARLPAWPSWRWGSPASWS